jgi:hypothetical protein
MPTGILGLSGDVSQIQELNPNFNKKTLHFYKIAEEEWHGVHESVFTGQRKMSMDTLDEAF